MSAAKVVVVIPARYGSTRLPGKPLVMLAGSEVPLLDLPNLSSATNHNGGSVHFGSDGKLYVSVGENANSANSQVLTNTLGKLLRINSDGTVPTDNPFYDGSGPNWDSVPAASAGFDGGLHFRGRCLSREDALVEHLHVALLGRSGGKVRRFGERLGLRDDEGAVHHVERLLRDARRRALRVHEVRAREIECAQRAGEILPVDVRIDGAAFREGFVEKFHRASADGRVECAGCREQRVVHRLPFEALPVLPPEQMVFGIDRLRIFDC